MKVRGKGRLENGGANRQKNHTQHKMMKAAGVQLLRIPSGLKDLKLRTILCAAEQTQAEMHKHKHGCCMLDASIQVSRSTQVARGSAASAPRPQAAERLQACTLCRLVDLFQHAASDTFAWPATD